MTIVIATVLNLSITIFALRVYLRKFAPYVRMARQFASAMGQQSQVVQHERKNVKLAAEAKVKVLDAAIETLPMGGILKQVLLKAQVSPDEIFALMQDQNFMKGVQVIIKTFSGVIDKISGKDKEETVMQQTNLLHTQY